MTRPRPKLKLIKTPEKTRRAGLFNREMQIALIIVASWVGFIIAAGLVLGYLF